MRFFASHARIIGKEGLIARRNIPFRKGSYEEFFISQERYDLIFFVKENRTLLYDKMAESIDKWYHMYILFFMKISPWVFQNLKLFDELSHNLWATRSGEVISKESSDIQKPVSLWMIAWSWEARKRVGRYWEQVVAALLVWSKRQRNGFDITTPSWIDKKPLWVEVKTCEKWNAGVVHQAQMERYVEHFGSHERVYLVQIFYSRSNKSEFIPELIYVFPMTLVIYLINSINTTGHDPRMKFTALRMKQARELEEVARARNEYSIAEIFHHWVKKNPNARVIITDHRKAPHLISKILQG